MQSTSTTPTYALRILLLLLILAAGISSIIGSGSTQDQLYDKARTFPKYTSPRHVRTGEMVLLDARNSDFINFNEPGGIDTNWKIKSQPTGSRATILSSSVFFQRYFIPDIDGTYTLELSTYKDGGSDQYASIPVNIYATSANAIPDADPGPLQSVAIGERVQLHGSGHDVEGENLSFKWSGKDAHLLSGTESASPFFTASNLKYYDFILTVSDSTHTSKESALFVPVDPEEGSRPNSITEPDIYTAPGTTVTLDGSASYDPYQRAITYQWRVFYAPETPTLANPNSATTTFTPETEGNYLFVLRTNNGSSGNLRDIINHNTYTQDRLVVHVRSNWPPVAVSSTDMDAEVSSTVTLDGSASHDPEGNGLSYHWRVFSGPFGSMSRISPDDGANTTFTPDLPGTYLIQLVVNDGELDSAPDVTVIRAHSNGPDALSVLTALPYAPVSFPVKRTVHK